MRISGGDARGITLKVPKGIRPASERVRQAVFASIARRIPDARVLDLYAGSGAYGLEAVSRGASSAVLVDRDRGSAEVCRANARSAGMSDDVRVRQAPVDRYLRREAGSDGPFDVVFVDPPYDAPMAEVLELLGPRLDPAGLVVLERRFRDEPAPEGGGLVVEADRRYGDTRVLMYSRGATG
jgi:16S rRNA (guanine966-N2)-methyltransferase